MVVIMVRLKRAIAKDTKHGKVVKRWVALTGISTSQCGAPLDFNSAAVISARAMGIDGSAVPWISSKAGEAGLITKGGKPEVCAHYGVKNQQLLWFGRLRFRC